MKKPFIALIAASLSVAFSRSPMAAQARSSIGQWAADVTQDRLRPSDVQATPFAANTSYVVCFTPGQDCEGLIVTEIKHAQKTILMQAYSFTSPPIAKALMEAKDRGVDVRAILDKSQRTERYTGATFLKHAGIPVVIDEKPAIAHSKIFIFDQHAVLTGSFNFTKAAQQKNAENLLVIDGDTRLVQAYTQNWKSRWDVSVAY